MSTPSQKYNMMSNKMRRALRKRYQETKISQKSLAIWFENTYKQQVARTTLSELLSKKWEWLDRPDSISEEAKRNAQPRWPIVEKVLVEWLLEQQSRQMPYSIKILTSVANEIWVSLPENLKIDPKTGEIAKAPNFSNGWCEKFKKRSNFTFTQGFVNGNCGPKEPIRQFEEISRICQDYALNCIYNVDEAGLFWSRSLEVDSSNEDSLNQEMNKFCLTLCTNGDGSDKLPPFIIGNKNRPRSSERKDWIWRANNVSWITVELMQEWLMCFFSHVKNKRVLLLMDDFWVHRCAFIPLNIPENVRIELLSSEHTGIFQPLQQGIIHEMKENFLKQILEESLRVHSAGGSIVTKPPLDNIQDTAVEYVNSAWTNGVYPKSIEDSFRKTILLQENCELERLIVPEISMELSALYDAVVAAGSFLNAIDVREFLYPDSEDDSPFSPVPSLNEMIQCHVPIPELIDLSDNEEESEGQVELQDQLLEDRSNDAYQDNQEELGDQHTIEWNEAIKSTELLIELMNYTNSSTASVRLHLQKVIGILAKKSKQGLEPFKTSDLETVQAIKKMSGFHDSQSQNHKQPSPFNTSVQHNTQSPIPAAFNHQPHPSSSIEPFQQSHRQVIQLPTPIRSPTRQGVQFPMPRINPQSVHTSNFPPVMSVSESCLQPVVRREPSYHEVAQSSFNTVSLPRVGPEVNFPRTHVPVDEDDLR